MEKHSLPIYKYNSVIGILVTPATHLEHNKSSLFSTLFPICI